MDAKNCNFNAESEPLGVNPFARFATFVVRGLGLRHKRRSFEPSIDAARFEGLAEDGEIFMSDRVAALLDNTHDVEHSGLTKLKGRQEPIDDYKFLADQAHPANI